MDDLNVLRALERWNLWKHDLESGIERISYLDRFESYSKTGQVVSVNGVRRSGKSYLLRQYLKHLAKKQGAMTTLYVNFEEPILGNLSVETIQNVIRIYQQHINPNTKPSIFLDEVQKVDGWERVVRAMHERGEADFFISGSSASLLSKEYGTLLTGRHLDIRVWPLSFYEFLKFNRILVVNELDLVSGKEQIQHLLLRYLREGGFPKVVLSDEKEVLLSTYFQDILSRDIVERYSVREASSLKDLANYYLSNASSLHSNNSIKKFIPLSHETIGRFTGYMEDAFLFFSVRKYANSLKEQQVNPRKIYCIDTGLIAALAFREGLGNLMENVVYLELRRRGKEPFYWKNRYGHEIDFVVKEKEKVSELIQVSYDFKAAAKREKRPFESWKTDNAPVKSTIITWDYEESGDVECIPLYRWLLQPYLQK